MSKDEQLKELLQARRTDVPSEREWILFDRSFQNRMLSSIKISWRDRISAKFLHYFSFGRVTAFGAMCVLLFVTVMRMTTTTSFVDSSDAATYANRQYIQYVADQLCDVCNPIGGGSVDTYSLNNDGIEYIQDIIVSQNSSALLAKV